jgi:ketosteroid isomerase-like protein
MHVRGERLCIPRAAAPCSCGILHRVMSDATTPDLVELTRRSFEALNRGDFDTSMEVFAPDAVWDASSPGIGTFKGRATIRSHLEEWLGAYEEFESELEECQDLGNGIVFSVLHHEGRPAGSTGRVQQRPIFVSKWVDGMIVRVEPYLEIDEARAAAKRLAEEPGVGDVAGSRGHRQANSGGVQPT